MKITSKIWSNLFFLIPLLLSAHYKMYVYTGLTLVLFIFSTLYHLSNKNKFKQLDKIFAYTIITYNLYLFYLANFKKIYFGTAFLFVLIGVYFLYIKKNDDWQWHLSSSIVSILSILAYSLI